MPTKLVHSWLCNELRISCPCPSGKCPLDKGTLHSIHHTTKPYHIPLRFGEFKARSLDHRHCERFLNAHFQRMQPWFSQLTDEQSRLCWTAHMVCDHASDYYWEALEASGRRQWYWYADFFKNDPGYKRFLLEMGRRVIADRCDGLRRRGQVGAVAMGQHSMRLLLTSLPDHGAKRHGSIKFVRLPVSDKTDFQCDPPNFIGLAAAKRISKVASESDQNYGLWGKYAWEWEEGSG